MVVQLKVGPVILLGALGCLLALFVELSDLLTLARS